MSQQIASAMFTVIEWQDSDIGFIECPGRHLHGGKNSKKDCRVSLDGVPTLSCFHSSCSDVLIEANYRFRRSLWENNPLPKKEFSSEEKEKIRADMAQKRKEQGLRDWANNNKENILKKYEWPMSDAFHESPFTTEDPAKDAAVFASCLYEPEDIIWNGAVTSSGSEQNKKNFKTITDWTRDGISGNFTCPSVFKEGSFERKNENVLSRPYLVVESDTLTQDQTCSLFKWISSFLELRAIIYTGGKSVHGWFKFPTEELFKRLKIVLPEMECDEALFKPSQPVRMPGIMRGDKLQSIIYLKP